MQRSLSPHAPNQLSIEREQVLFAVALEEFQDKGVDNATVDHIARRAGVSKGSIYRRFSSKEAFFQTVVGNKADSLARELDGFELDPSDPRESLTRTGKRIRELTLDNIDFQRLLVAESPRREKVTQDARIRINRQLTGKLCSFFRELIEAGKMDDLDVDHLVWTFYILSVGGMRPFYNITKSNYLENDADRFKQDIELFIKGCGIVT